MKLSKNRCSRLAPPCSSMLFGMVYAEGGREEAEARTDHPEGRQRSRRLSSPATSS